MEREHERLHKHMKHHAEHMNRTGTVPSATQVIMHATKRK